jgi:hypothetical protein
MVTNTGLDGQAIKDPVVGYKKKGFCGLSRKEIGKLIGLNN